MTDPVATVDGQSYERDAIQEWFRRRHRTSPATGAFCFWCTLLPAPPVVDMAVIDISTCSKDKGKS